MKAPYVKVSEIFELEGHKVVKYDLRFRQPYDDDVMDGTTLHSIEHMMTKALKEAGNNTVVGFSPMGSKTGFYLTVLDPPQDYTENDILKAMLAVLQYNEVPGRSKSQCGNYTYHNYDFAKQSISEFVKGYYGISINN
jgi:S-ribosylhomocysteine lyase